MEDREIVALYWQRDEQAIAESARKYGALCRRIAENILTLREDAEECVNDSYHAAWNAIPSAKPESLRAFLGRITRNLAIDRCRAAHTGKRYAGAELLLSELSDCLPSPDTIERSMEAAELSAAISAWLDSLPEADCALFVRRYWYGDAVQELARRCGVTAAQMAQRMLRLRRSLRSALEAEGVSI